MNEKIISFTEKAQARANNSTASVPESTTVTFCTQLCGVNVATINNARDGRFTLMIDGWKQLGAAQFNVLVDFCEELMGCSPICSYEIAYASGKGLSTVIEWRKNPDEERAFLRMLVNSHGFANRSYENLRLYGDRNGRDYVDPDLAQQLAAYRAKAAII